MIKLFQVPPAWGLANFSPSCLKLETWLRMVDIPYQAAPADMSKAPKGKVPYIEEDGRLLGDSTLIIEHLKSRYGRDPDTGLSAAERAVSLAFRRMLKENFYWVIIDIRWRDEENWLVYRDMMTSTVLPGVPAEIAERVLGDIRTSTLSQLHGHGMGRHSRQEVAQIGMADVGAISDFLADKPFFLGERPTTVDATVYGYIANLIQVPMESPVKDFGLSRPNLLPYCRRMAERFFPSVSG